MEQHLIMPTHTCVQKTSSRQISHNSHHPIIMINAGEVSLPGVFCINYPKAITAAWSNTGVQWEWKKPGRAVSLTPRARITNRI